MLRFFRMSLVACSCMLATYAAAADTSAVLPFINVSSAVSSAASGVSQASSGVAPSASGASSSLDWIGESVAETIREALASHGLVTLDRDNVLEAYRRLRLRPTLEPSTASVLKLGEALDAELVIAGTFTATPSAPSVPSGSDSKGSLKIVARVTDRHRLHQSPEFIETGSLEDLASLEAHLAWRALQLLAPQSAPPESDFRSLRANTRLDAEESYTRGLLAASPDQKEKYFLQAARLDPGYAHPAFQLGKLHLTRKEYKQAVDWLERVGASDAHFREANFFLGLARLETGDASGAQKAFQQIASIVPLSEVFNNLAVAENRRNLPQAVDDFRKALEGDPNDPDYHFNLGYALFKRGDFPAAADRFRAVLDRVPDDQMATLLLGRSLKKQGLRPGDARSADGRLQTLERLKHNYEERAYWQLKSVLETKSP
jgi:tetratricopeptide (TPR) repeat protein